MTPRHSVRASAQAVLTASEIGNFGFCPVAWYLQRRGEPRHPASIVAIEDGIGEHRRIAGHAVRVRALRRPRGIVLLVIILLLAGIVLQVLNSAGLTPT